MWDTLRTIVGEVRPNEVALVGVLFALVMLYAQAPRLGGLVGRLFQRRSK
ncbi:MAG: hypothetical protein IT373_38200 [Polyangiaceae bacterium]|nr:hypothetical protein [Polyangiaceae bacterium]